MARDKYTIASLDSGLQVLLMFLEHDTISVTDAAQELGMARSTAHRVLTTLQQRGLVNLSRSGRGYAPGPALVEIARPRVLDPETRRAMRPILDDAVARCNESVHTTALLGSQIILIDGREADQPIRVGLRAGMIRPAYVTSAGKLLLSRLTQDQVAALYPRENLLKTTSRSISTRTALFEELRKISKQDHAFTRQESEDRVHGVSVLLAGDTWRDRVALMASVPEERASDAELKAVVAALRESAKLLVAR